MICFNQVIEDVRFSHQYEKIQFIEIVKPFINENVTVKIYLKNSEKLYLPEQEIWEKSLNLSSSQDHDLFLNILLVFKYSTHVPDENCVFIRINDYAEDIFESEERFPIKSFLIFRLLTNNQKFIKTIYEFLGDLVEKKTIFTNPYPIETVILLNHIDNDPQYTDALQKLHGKDVKIVIKEVEFNELNDILNFLDKLGKDTFCYIGDVDKPYIAYAACYNRNFGLYENEKRKSSDLSLPDLKCIYHYINGEVKTYSYEEIQKHVGGMPEIISPEILDRLKNLSSPRIIN